MHAGCRESGTPEQRRSSRHHRGTHTPATSCCPPMRDAPQPSRRARCPAPPAARSTQGSGRRCEGGGRRGEPGAALRRATRRREHRQPACDGGCVHAPPSSRPPPCPHLLPSRFEGTGCLWTGAAVAHVRPASAPHQPPCLPALPAQNLVSLDDGAGSGPAVRAGQQLAYTRVKLQGGNATYWSVVAADDGTLWRFPSAELTYCDGPAGACTLQPPEEAACARRLVFCSAAGRLASWPPLTQSCSPANPHSLPGPPRLHIPQRGGSLVRRHSRVLRRPAVHGPE